MPVTQEWIVLYRGKEQGPFSSTQIKQLVGAGKILPDTKIRLRESANWRDAGSIPGLFQPTEKKIEHQPKTEIATISTVPAPIPNRYSNGKGANSERANPVVAVPKSLTPVPNQNLPVQQQNWAVPATQSPPLTSLPTHYPPLQQEQRVACPYCGEQILATAVKCRHCNEFLDQRLRQNAQPQMVTPAAAPTVVVNQNTVVGPQYIPMHTQRWSPGVAMVLSFLFPGLGQLYKGQIINGFVWFVAVVIGYIAFIIPGLFLHLCCVIGAGMGDPYR